jgi:hypothetical protein
VFAIFFTQMVADYATDNEDFGPGMPLFEYFGSTGDAVNSLYKAITGGADWENMSTPLMTHISTWLGVVFALYVAFGALVLLNLVTGVFVDGAMNLNKQDHQFDVLKQARKVFKRYDDIDGSGTITPEEFKQEIDTEAMQEMLQLIDVRPTQASELFDILDWDGNGSLSLTEFVTGAMSLKGPAKAIDVLLIGREMIESFDCIVDALKQLAGNTRTDMPAVVLTDLEEKEEENNPTVICVP